VKGGGEMAETKPGIELFERVALDGIRAEIKKFEEYYKVSSE